MTTQSQLRKAALNAVTQCQDFGGCAKWHAAFDAAEALVRDDPYAYGVGDAADWAVTEFYRVSE